MIRRLQTDVIREDMTRRLVSGGRPLPVMAEEGALAAGAPSDEAYRKGYAEGFESGEADGLRDAGERMQEMEEIASRRANDLFEERERLTLLMDGIVDALRDHDDAIEHLAFEIAFTSLTRAIGEIHTDGQLMRRLCAEVVDEFRHAAKHVAVSTHDRPLMPDQIDGLEIVADPTLAPGGCRVVTERGEVESSLSMRLDAIYRTMLEALETAGR